MSEKAHPVDVFFLKFSENASSWTRFLSMSAKTHPTECVFAHSLQNRSIFLNLEKKKNGIFNQFKKKKKEIHMHNLINN